VEKQDSFKIASVRNCDPNLQLRGQSSSRRAKANQAAKIAELRRALELAGLHSLDAQAEALALCRSTTWAILKRDYKASGLTAAVIKRMLSAPRLPREVRQVIEEYVEQKASGAYGHSTKQCRAFHDQFQCDAAGPVKARAR